MPTPKRCPAKSPAPHIDTVLRRGMDDPALSAELREWCRALLAGDYTDSEQVAAQLAECDKRERNT